MRSTAAPASDSEAFTIAENLALRVNATFREVYGPGTVEAEEISIEASNFITMTMSLAVYGGGPSLANVVEKFEEGRRRAIARLESSLQLMRDKSEGGQETTRHERILKAYEALELYPAIADAASDLYRDGHYANAIEDAVKALNDLVRLKSGVSLDGEKLMTTAFSPEKPYVRFNELADLNDKDEQRGFMMMFAGAVAGLRNPRAHKLIKDDEERALEFIAFISLLAKLLEGGKRVRPQG